MSYDTILIPTDGEQPSERAAVHAVEFAAAFDATIHAMYVLDAAERPPTVDDPGQHPELEDKRNHVFDTVTEAAAEHDLPPIVEVIVRGTTDRAILEYIEDKDVDLVVMGTHGRSGMDRLVIGSVAESVARNADVPVVTTRETVPDP